MRLFFSDLKKYFSYAVFQARQDLKTEVANSYLNWLWLILDPFFYMMIYTFVSVVVFRTQEPYFPVFVFLGLTYWEFFNRMILQSIRIISSNKAIVTKVYIPKYILILSRIFVNGFKMMISFVLVFILMLVYKVPLSPYIALVIPLTLNMMLVTFGLSMIVCHFGVFIEDLQHIAEIVLKFLFYFTGIFYVIEKSVPDPYAYILVRFNPVANNINELRKAVLYGTNINWPWTIAWFIAGFICIAIGAKLIYRYENTYVKVI